MSHREWIVGLILAIGGIPYGAWLIAIGIEDWLSRRRSPERQAELERIDAAAQRLIAWRPWARRG